MSLLLLFQTSVVSDVNASLDVTLDALTLSAEADVAVSASSTITLGDLTCASTATVDVAASLAVTLGALTLASSVTSGGVVIDPNPTVIAVPAYDRTIAVPAYDRTIAVPEE